MASNKALVIYSMRPMQPSDLQYIGVPRTRRLILKLRESHHHIARLAALGQSGVQIASRTGYSATRVQMLMNDPSMQELISRYRDKADDTWIESIDDYHSIIFSNMTKAERQISDRLDEADETGESLPIRDLVAVSRDAADRLGLGKKSTVTNLNVDFAAKLEAAIGRSAKVIELSSSEVSIRRRA